MFFHQTFKVFGLAILSCFLLLAGLSQVSAADFTTGIQSGVIKNNSVQTQHFQIEFSDLVKTQADSDGDSYPNVVEQVAESAEVAWDVLVGRLDYEAPNSPVFIVLDDVGAYLPEGALGVTTAFSDGSLFVAVNPWLSNSLLQVTVVHEFFHVIQFSYDFNFAYSPQAVNWAEASAVWIEDVIYDGVNDYVNYLGDFFSYTDYSLFASLAPADTLFSYALNIWPIYLSEYYDDDIIRDIWEDYFDASASYLDHTKLYLAFADVLSAKGEDLRETFQRFTLWNLDSWDQYEEGELYPSVSAIIDVEYGEYASPPVVLAPALYGTNYLYFKNDEGESKFFFHLVKPEGISFALSLVPIASGNPDLSRKISVIIDRDEIQDAALELNMLGYEAVMAVISPLDLEFENDLNENVFDEGYSYFYLASYGDNPQEIIDDSRSPGATDDLVTPDKLGEISVLNPDLGEVQGLYLNVVDYDENSVSFSWERVSDEDLAGYELYYSSDLDGEEVIEIEKEYLTFYKVSGLEEGAEYTFYMKAVDEEGDTIDELSPEIIITPAEWLYSDVSYLHKNFEAIAGLTEEGIFQGYPDGSFGPNNSINRAELLKILLEGQGISPDAPKKSCFPDVVHGSWYEPYVCHAKSEDWIQGYDDGTFRPSQTVSKVEALKILYETYGVDLEEGKRVSSLPYSDLGLAEWYSVYVYEAAADGILTETIGEDFHPSNGRIRAEMAEELYRFIALME